MRLVVVKMLMMVVTLVLVFVVGCSPKVTPAPQVPAPAATAAAPAPALAAKPAAPSKPAWEDKWEQALTAAKKEGRVVLMTTAGGELRAALMRGFKSAYGLDVEVVAGRTAESLPKILAERRSGLYSTDVNVSGYTSILTVAKPAGILEKLDASLVLPDVTDPELIKKIWYQGKLPWVDNDHTVFFMSLQAQAPFAINTNLVKEGDIKSYRDVLNPRWQGNVLINDPTVAGAGQQTATATALIMGWDYLVELVKTKPLVLRDQRLMLEWLAHGKIAIVHGPRSEAMPEFYNVKAPIQAFTPVEGTRLTAGSSGVERFTNAPHPNAATVFLNWLFSKEGQTIHAVAAGHQSAREDVSTAHLRPDQMRQPGMKYLDTYTEDSQTRTAEMEKSLRELFASLIK